MMHTKSCLNLRIECSVDRKDANLLHLKFKESINQYENTSGLHLGKEEDWQGISNIIRGDVIQCLAGFNDWPLVLWIFWISYEIISTVPCKLQNRNWC